MTQSRGEYYGSLGSNDFSYTLVPIVELSLVIIFFNLTSLSPQFRTLQNLTYNGQDVEICSSSE